MGTTHIRQQSVLEFKSNRTSSFTSDSRRIGIASSFPIYDDRKGWKGSLWIEKLLV
ncbi:MAG: hypothetical protein GY820_13130 [Gammaproteobacteria bacterium]|nr:hypothetical protein [Gammaproteobacteria bacterium]